MGEWNECSGDPMDCPENEGYGCCNPNPASKSSPEHQTTMLLCRMVLNQVVVLDAPQPPESP